MSIKKLTLATLILVGLTACGSSGSGSSSNKADLDKSKITVPKDIKDKADKAKKEAEERLEKAKKEEERLAKEAKKAKEDAERLAKEDAERLAKEDAERLAKEAEKAKGEAQRLAKEKAEKAKAEAIKLKGTDDKEYAVIKEMKSSDNTRKGHIYNQPYSVVTASTLVTLGETPNENDSLVEIKGLKTTALPQEGKATYSGKLFEFTNVDSSDLTYNVDFGKRKGSGVAKGQETSIELKEGSIENGAISSTVTSSGGILDGKQGSYKVEFFGPKAEEIAGEVEIKNIDSTGLSIKYGLAGSRGEISK
ncbi:TPA: colicin transporter [Mannheimia haemolytica]|nr:colicin transporter [Mannheimia haemolytica]